MNKLYTVSVYHESDENTFTCFTLMSKNIMKEENLIKCVDNYFTSHSFVDINKLRYKFEELTLEDLGTLPFYSYKYNALSHLLYFDYRFGRWVMNEYEVPNTNIFNYLKDTQFHVFLMGSEFSNISVNMIKNELDVLFRYLCIDATERLRHIGYYNILNQNKELDVDFFIESIIKKETCGDRFLLFHYNHDIEEIKKIKAKFIAADKDVKIFQLSKSKKIYEINLKADDIEMKRVK